MRESDFHSWFYLFIYLVEDGLPSPDSETIGNSALPKRRGVFLPNPSAGGLRVGARGGHLPGETLRPSRSASVLPTGVTTGR